jgi:hypothetical protein
MGALSCLEAPVVTVWASLEGSLCIRRLVGMIVSSSVYR